MGYPYDREDNNLQEVYEEFFEKERCSGSFHLAVGFLVIKDDSISERLG